MLDNDSLIAIERIITHAIADSEARIKNEIRAEINAALDSAESRMITYFDETLQKSVNTIADGHKMLVDKLSSIGEIKNEIDEMKGSITAIEAVVVKNRANIIDLQEAKYK